MIGAVQKYRELIFELLLEREVAPDGLSQESEARYAGALDRCWYAMSEEEQEAIENELASKASPTVAEEPSWQDREVNKGSTELPRVLTGKCSKYT
jgi:hypothetical protein